MSTAFLLHLLAACQGDTSIGKVTVDADSDGYDASVDCDDAHADVNPDADERCDGVDNDCDEAVDEDAVDAPAWYADADGDTYGDPRVSTSACDAPAGTVADATDCDDASAPAHPGTVEVCDGIDDDCDGAIDEDAADAQTWYADTDEDGYGDVDAAVVACPTPAGHVADATDCDDARDDVHPGAAETDCTDPTDYNCDGSIGYADADGDGFPACLDCADDDGARSPGATEVCDDDDLDEDCDGLSDDDDPDAVGTADWYRDADGDGYGAGAASTQCDGGAGYASLDGDCDDLDRTANPGAAEVCDTYDTDEDCDGLVDDAEARPAPRSATASTTTATGQPTTPTPAGRAARPGTRTGTGTGTGAPPR